MNKPRTRLPLSLPQSDIFWDQLRNENSPVYNIGGYIKCRKLDLEKINWAHEKVINGNDAFGIRVNYDADEVYQYISDERETDLVFIDFSVHVDALAKAKSWLQQVFESPLPFIDTSLFKTWLVKVEEDQYWYVGFAHHLIMDGWGFSNWAKEISRLYNQCSGDEDTTITPLALNTVLLKDAKYLKSQRYLKDRAYWQTRYHQDNSSIIRANYASEFAHSRACPSRRFELPLSRDFYRQIKGLSQEFKVSISHIFLGVLSKYFFSAYSASSLCFGIPAHNRGNFAEKKMIGVFTGVNPFSVEVEPGQTFRDLVSKIASQQKSDFRHQKYPISHISRDLGITAHGNAIYEIMFNFLQLDYRDLFFDSYQGELNYVSHNHHKTPLAITLWDGGAEQVELQFEYSLACFVEQEIQVLSERILLLLQSFLSCPDTLLSDVDILTPAEKALLLTENHYQTESSLSCLCIHEFFEARVSLHPEQEAVLCNGASLTYDDLNRRANQLAHYLKAQGVKPETLVGVCVERSLDMVVAILAILKAGGAYLPLDPDYPESRLAYMLSDSGVDIVLTQSQVLDSLPFLESWALCLDDAQLAIRLTAMPSDNLSVSSVGLCAEHLAYVIYTSGSTGKPKGVMVEHRNTAALLAWALDFYSRETLGCVLASTSMCFDLSIFEIFAPLAAGGSVLIVKNILNFFETDALDKVTLVNTVPSAAKVLLSGKKLPVKLKTINLAGEALKQDLVDSLYQAGFSSVYDLYGPSEDTTYSTYKLRTAKGRASIGTGIANTQLYVLTQSGQLAPKGVSGELYIGGAGLTRGYLNRPELNDEKFVTNPFYGGLGSNSSKRLYRTGDLVRWLPSGELEYLGRIDHQVKVRGYRIELGEIEHVLEECDGIKEAVVLAREAGGNDKRLVGYLVATGADSHEARLIEEARQHARKTLPDYMVPSAFVLLEHLPLTANGKVDRNALPEPEASSLSGAYVAPQTVTEKTLCRIWQEILLLERVGIQDNFFELGGHSLLVTKLVARCGEAFEVTLPLREIFNQPKLAALAAFIDSCDRGLQGPPLLPVSREQALPLSYAQQRLWLLDKIDGGSTHYNMPAALKLTGTLNQDALKQAFSAIVVRHESLRTCFIGGDDGEPIQVLQEADTFDIPFTDLSTLTTGIREAEIAEVIAKEAVSAFDLSQDLMLRTRLLKVSDLEHILLVTMHHIASDGWSMGILVNEFSQLYRAYVQGEEASLAPLAIQYGDYAYWQRQWLQGDVLEQQLDYWQNQLSNLPVVHSLPLDYARPMVQSFTGDVHASSLDKNDVARLTALCQSHGATLFMGLHAAFSVLLSRYSNEQDIVVGTPVANREQSEIAELIGFFVNTLVLRSDLSGSPSFHDLLGQSKRCLLDAYDHQQVPFEQIVDRLQPERSLSHSPLFQVMLSLQNNDQGSLSLPGLELSMVEGGGQTAKFDLTLNMAEEAGGLGLYWEFNTAVFKDETIVRMAEHFEVLLSALLQSPERDVFSHELVTSREREQLLESSQDIECLTPSRSCLHELFEEQAARHPEKIALVYEASRLSYGELNRRANQLARYLTAQGVKPDTLVGLCVERSLETVVGMLAILKAGGAYVPLDPANPQSRLTYMLEDSGVQTVLTSQAVLAQLPVLADKALCLDDEAVQAQLSDMSVQNLSVSSLGLASHHLAYVIYTSGSTGQPKGVLVQHNNVTRLLGTSQAHFDFSEADVWTLFHSYAFDFSVWEIWGALGYGGRLVIVPYWVSRSSGDFYQLLVQEKVTVLNQTPSAFNLLVAEDSRRDEPLALRYVVFGGEALNFTQLKPWVARHGDNTPELVNMYGITETTVHVTYRRIREQDLTQGRGASLIGKPLADLDILLLNEKQVLVPDGIGGEMYVSGHGVSRGYLNREELSAERFVCLPGQGVKRFYRTGDLARRQEGGELEYLGRIDHQVKVRGFRIELGEIEHALATHSDIQEALVLARDNGENNSQLVAYLVVGDSERETGALIEDVKGHIRQALPEYMVPSAYMILEALPLTANGKVNAKALPEPDIGLSRAEYVAPKSDTERALCSIWQQVLEVERVGIMDNFFQLGGHSLLATKLVARINETFDISLPLREVISRPILAELAAVLSGYERDPNRLQLTPVCRELALPLSYAQQRLWLLDRIDGGSAHYNMSGALRLEGKLNVQALERAFFTVVQRHESLRTRFISMGDGDPRQEIQENFTFHVPVTDLSTFTAGEQQVQLAVAVSAEASRTFDLSQELMLRAQLLKLSSREHIVLVTMHHIASDGWSMGILVNEFSRLYRAYVQGEDNPLIPLAIQYGDYAHWQRNYLQGPRLDEQLAFWQDRLAGLPVVHNLPLDRPRAARQSFAGNVHYSSVDKACLRKLMQLCQAQGATLFMGLHASFSVLLSRYSNENDIVVGTPVANREQLEVADLIGFFVNTLVLRSDTSGNPGFRELLAQSKQMLLDAYAHQQVPFELLVERLQPERNLSHMPLFQVMLALQNNDGGSLSLPGLTLSAMEDQGVGTAKFDLTLNVIESEQGLQLKWGFNIDLFDIETIKQMAGHFETLLLAMVQSPEKDVFAHELVTGQERRLLLNAGKDRVSSVVPQLCIHELFEAQAASQPNKIALITQEGSLNYGELNRRANQLAHHLKLQGVKPDTLVGLCVDRSMDMVIGILAILKAGGAYVPFDPSYPESRLLYMLKDSGVDTVLTQERVLADLPSLAAHALCLDKESVQTELVNMSEDNLPVSSLGLTASHLAYVIYTSGSTGQAKGVLIEHQGIVNLAAEIQRMDIVPEGACWGLNASYAFDSSVKGLSQLMSGVPLRILPRYADQESQTIGRTFGQCGVLDCTPLMVEAWFDLGLESTLPNLIIGGEAISPQLWARLCDWQQQYQRKAVNVYGPTECSVNTHWTPISGDLPHIGYPLGNVRALILNENTLAPGGVPGELCIGGIGLARGYLNQDKLTAEKFITNPYFNEQDNNSCQRLYRTGDLVRRLADGRLEFIGRTDHQVKIRGFRIEPAEIEHVLADFSRVKEAVVLARDAGEKGKHLVGYLLAEDAESDKSGLIEAVRQHVGKLLPEYMVPSDFVVLESFPLTANGKFDRNALPEPSNEMSDDGFSAPQTEGEKALSVIWQELLGLERIALTDNFFELGGHSLLATKLVARVSESFDVKIKLRDIFKQPVLASLAEFISAQKQGKNHPPLIQVSRTQALPLSFAQQRLWLLDQIDGGSAHYNMPAALKLTGTLNEDALQQAITTILLRHESLRTYFVAGDDGEPIQLIRELDSFEVALTDLSALSQQALQTRIAEAVSTEAGKRFDLTRDLMLRAQLLKISAKEHILLVTMHHIASDGWSREILVNEFSRLYTAYAQGQDNPLPPLAIQYGDYAHWQRNYLQGAVLNEQLAYWKKQLADLPVLHSLPLDHPRPAVQSFAGNLYVSRIEQATHQRLMAMCQERGATLFMGLHAVFSVLLARYSNEQDIVVGTPVANREQVEVAGLIGFFVNTLVLRSNLSDNPSFHALLEQSKNMLLDAYAHQQVPFEQIVERLQPERSLSHSPLFQVMIALQNNETGHLSLPGLELSEVQKQGPGIAQFDLTLNISEAADGLILAWEYNTDLFEAQTIERMAGHFEVLLSSLLTSPELDVYAHELVTPQEREQLLDTWNDTAAKYRSELCLHELFERQVDTHPKKTALVCEETSLSYETLNCRANQLAHYLKAQGVKPDTLVGLSVERSVDMVIAILAILKAGGAYVPLDPSYPQTRLRHMLSDSGVTLVLTQHSVREQLPDCCGQVLCLDDGALQEALTKMATDNLPVSSLGLAPRHLAYVIYTSGSTGQPKGIMVQHQAMLVRQDGWNRVFDLEKRPPVVLQMAGLSVDILLGDMMKALGCGGRLEICPKEVLLSPDKLYQMIQSREITYGDFVPAVIRALTDHLLESGQKLDAMAYISVGCEAWYGRDLRRLKRVIGENTECFNLYGQTESVIDASYCRATELVLADVDTVPVGQPLANTGLYVLNEQQQLQPYGVAGELCVGGKGLALGYAGRAGLTAEKFLAHPFTEEVGQGLYRTGDQAVRRADGSLHFVGRDDEQVKIRGFRVEVKEVEGRLLALEAVKAALVLARQDEGQHKRLVGYLLFEPGQSCSLAALAEHMRAGLPDYMVPSAFVVLESFPLTANGTVDRKALPAPEGDVLGGEYIAPRTETEKTLCRIWQEVLGLERVGISDNFFDLGGHSLLVTKLVARIGEAFEVTLALRKVFEQPRLMDLAALLSGEHSGGMRPPLTAVSREQALPLSFAQQRLWLLDKIDGGSVHYNMPAALRLTGSLNSQALQQAFSTIVGRHESLRTCFVVGDDGEPVQVINTPQAFEVPLTDLSVLPETVQQTQIDEAVAKEAAAAFELSRDLMLRAHLLKVAEQEHILLVTMHHIASDGWSMGILVNEFSSLYTAYAKGQENPLAPLAIQYGDYAYWQRNWLQGAVLDEQLGYWEKQLAGLPVVHALPLDHARPAVQSFAGAFHITHINKSTYKALTGLCQAQGATLFMGLHAAFSVLLSRYSDEQDIVIGTPVANREQVEVAGLIGFFVNTLVLRSDLSGKPSFQALLEQSKNMLLDGYAHQQVPFEQIVERLQPERSLSHSPLFQVMLALQNNDDGQLSLPGIELTTLGGAGGKNAKFDLTLNLVEEEDGQTLSWVFNTDLFERDTIARMAEHFEVLLSALVQAPEQDVFSHELATAQEREQLLGRWNNTEAEVPLEYCLHELFAEQADRFSKKAALVCDGMSLSYGELNRRANQLAHYLKAQGVKAQTLVGLCVERSVDMVVGILGILKAGGAYVPLDPAYPQARLAYMLSDTNVALVLAQQSVLKQLPVFDGQVICLDDEALQAELMTMPVQSLIVSGLTPSHLAYVIYTSGSTGQPKGVMVAHESVTAFAVNNRYVAVSEVEHVASLSSYAFDGFVFDLFFSLLNGKTVSLLGKNHILDSGSFKSALTANGIDTFFTTTALFNQMILNDTLGDSGVKNVLFGGEKADPGLVERAVQRYPSIAFTHVYGPTETTVFASAHHFGDEVDPAIPIGKPLHNKQCYVLDAALNPVPVGVVGELYIGGLGLARGYLNRPALTAEKFVINPFYDEKNSRSSKQLYRTGDLVRWLANGSLVFIARADHQVKVRGFRIELGEIEHALTGQSDIKEAVVLAREIGDNNTQLVAYLVSSEAGQQDAELIEQVRGHLRQVLPDYMVPAAFVVLDALPLSANGKVNRHALPEPDMEALRAEYIAPQTETEIRLSEIWQQVLGLEKVGITDSFFELGGHSLLATKLVARINETFAINFPIKVFFEHNTIEKQAKLIGNNLFDETQIVIPQRNKMISNQDELEEIEL